MISTENYCEHFAQFHPKQVVLLLEVCGINLELNKSWQPATLGRLFSFHFLGSIVKPMPNLI